MSEPTEPDAQRPAPTSRPPESGDIQQPEGSPQPEATPPPVGWLPQGAAELFGEGASAEEAYGLLTVDVPADAWLTALETARTTLGCTFFDWLSAVDEPGTGFRVCAHLVALPGPAATGVRRLVVRTTVPHDKPALPTAIGVYAGAAWHERETHEMFGVDFTGHPHLVPLLLPESFEGHPLRKDFVLAARVAKAWPGAKEPGETESGGPKRRQMLPPGVPDPNEWGPLKGQLPPAPARPARGARAAGAGAPAAGDRPVRRARSVGEGSASQQPAGDAPARRARSVSEGSASQQEAGAAPARRTRSVSEGSASQQAAEAVESPSTADDAAGRPVRRSRSAAEGSASQQETGAAPARRARSASEGSASQQAAAESAEPGAAAPARRSRSAADGSASQTASPAPRGAAAQPPRSSDAPWHHARPAFDDDTRPEPGSDAPAEPPAPDGDASSQPPVAEEPAEPGAPRRPGGARTEDQEPGAKRPDAAGGDTRG